MSAWSVSLARFVVDMAEALDENDYKSGWDYLPLPHLLKRLRQEVGELERAIGCAQTCSHGVLRRKYNKVRHEAADVANFCMMIADYAREIEKAPDER